ncbi:MAG: hypothetical protein MZV65_14950 [Chromatiales bacterium]|nr:hypothetical protein [Chromatiales bacterium]
MTLIFSSHGLGLAGWPWVSANSSSATSLIRSRLDFRNARLVRLVASLDVPDDGLFGFLDLSAAPWRGFGVHALIPHRLGKTLPPGLRGVPSDMQAPAIPAQAFHRKMAMGMGLVGMQGKHIFVILPESFWANCRTAFRTPSGSVVSGMDETMCMVSRRAL